MTAARKRTGSIAMLALGTGLLLFAALANAQEAQPMQHDPDWWITLAGKVVQAALDKDWSMLVGLVLTGVVAGLAALLVLFERKANDKDWVGWRGLAGVVAGRLASSNGKRFMVFAGAFLGMVASTLTAHKAVDGPMLRAAFHGALLAGGGWSLILEPLKDWVKAKFFAPKAVP